MLIDNDPDPLRRIHRPEFLPDLVSWAAARCDLGPVYRHRVCTVGYDDCNLLVETGTGRYVFKIFTIHRPEPLTTRYVEVIRTALAAGVRHPRLHPTAGEALLCHPPSGNRLIVMDHLDGGTFLDRDGHPNAGQLADLMAQVSRIHRIQRDFAPVPDWWAVHEIGALAREMLPLLPADDRVQVERAVASFDEVDRAVLPHALVHGDLTKANVLPTSPHQVAILDFAVANRYPRVHELAMVAVNLMHGDPRPLRERVDTLLGMYPAAPLTPAEHHALPRYVHATAAMELLGAAREWVLKGNRSDETRYLIGLGRAGLRAARRYVENDASSRRRR
ncbi:phosphotransferase [Plantactinospora sp. KLBMP9567]|uniref:phosphotransferase n=1 Tax=Plantactinospora sp. KLBMP9567 TaxID=3085900 RepID=UPI0029822D46|nr:phosphotransferase [Plantactinospora sp. KLBMP9567]MDW5328869.1 phosphotransferase [Plantactinospora sp. KLBMP9567]